MDLKSKPRFKAASTVSAEGFCWWCS